MDQLLFSKENSHALVIGIGKRAEDNDIMQITASDAELLSAELAKRCPFLPANIRALTNDNAASNNILTELDQLAKLTAETPASMVLLYFSGHGCKIGNDYFLVCRNTTNNNIKGSAINGSELVKKLEAINTDKMLILLDCCHSGGVAVADSVADIPFEARQLLASKPNRVVLTSSEENKVSFICTPHSLFTHTIIEGLSGKYFDTGEKKDITIFDLAMYVRERTFTLSKFRQRPQLQVIQNAATYNFLLVEKANVQPESASDYVLKDENKKDLNMAEVPVRDDEFRKEYTWITKNNTVIGNNNIILQDITGSTITLNINGDIREIKALRSELQKVMEEFKQYSFQAWKRPYDIREFSDYKFDFVTGKKSFNEVLTRQLMEAIRPYSSLANDFFNSIGEKNAGWESKAKFNTVAKTILESGFVGVLGIQLRKLMAIGVQPLSTEKQKKYIENCILTAKRALQLLCFASISTFWDHKKENKYKLNAEQEKIFSDFFDSSFEADLAGYLALHNTLIDIFSELRLSYPYKEVTDFNILRHPGSKFQKAFTHLHEINSILDSEQYILLDCFEAESCLATILETLSFLANYKMVSIKKITYHEMKNNDPRYLHKYMQLEVTDNMNDKPERVNYVKTSINTDAILLYTGKYEDSINLFPFIVDINALSDQTGSKVCIYTSRDLKDKKCLNYSCLEDNSPDKIKYIEILKAGIDINELLVNAETFKQVKFDGVFSLFIQARDKILSE